MLSTKTPISWWIGVGLCVLTAAYLAISPPLGSSQEKAGAARQHFQTARTLRSEGRIPEAVAEFRRFLALSSRETSPDFLRQQAEAAIFVIPYQTEAENQALIPDIDRRLHGRPALQSQFYFRLSEYYEWTRRYDQATFYMKEVIRLLEPSPDITPRQSLYFDAYRRLGRLLEKSGDFTGAIAALQKASASQEVRFLRSRLHAIFRLANLYLRLNRAADARQLLQAVEKDVSTTPSALVFYYRLYHFNRMYNQSAEAERCYQRCLDLAQRLPELKSVKRPQGDTQAMEAYRAIFLSHFFLGKLFKDRGESSRAIPPFEQIVTYAPRQPMPMRWAQAAAALLSLYEKTGVAKETIDAYIKQTLPKLNKRASTQFLHHVIGYYERQNQPHTVKAYAQQLLDVSARLPWGPDAQLGRLRGINYFRLANLLAGEGNRVEAVTYYYKMLTSPTYGPYFFKSQMESAFQLAKLYHEMGRGSEVDKIFQEATRKVDEILYSDAARSQMFYERHKKELLKIGIDFHYRAAQYYDKAGQKKTAEQHLQSIIKIKAKS